MITSSVIASQNIQIDGRSEVREIHTDDKGVQYIFDYMANPGMDLNAKLQANADELNLQLSTQASDGL